MQRFCLWARIANLSVCRESRQIGANAQPKLTNGAESFEPEHVHFKFEHKSSKGYALHILMECLVSGVHAALCSEKL